MKWFKNRELTSDEQLAQNVRDAVAIYNKAVIEAKKAGLSIGLTEDYGVCQHIYGYPLKVNWITRNTRNEF